MSKWLHVATFNLITLDFKSSINIFYKYVRRFLSFLISLHSPSRSLIIFCHSFSWLDLDCLLNSLADVFVIYLRLSNSINLPKISYLFWVQRYLSLLLYGWITSTFFVSVLSNSFGKFPPRILDPLLCISPPYHRSHRSSSYRLLFLDPTFIPHHFCAAL